MSSSAKMNKPCSDLVCKLNTPEFNIRKATVLADLKKEVLESKEVESGFSYKFAGSDKMIDQLCEFIKTERQCCEFFNFTLSISKETNFIWLEINGPQGAKDFITTELGLTSY